MNRRLALKRESLSALTSDDLAVVGGAGILSHDICVNWPTYDARCHALSIDCLTGYYPSVNAPCDTTN